jgi:hypothetical protein
MRFAHGRIIDFYFVAKLTYALAPYARFSSVSVSVRTLALFVSLHK